MANKPIKITRCPQCFQRGTLFIRGNKSWCDKKKYFCTICGDFCDHDLQQMARNNIRRAQNKRKDKRKVG